ncbi:20990_t:CDS:2, partial [Racocetra persica]
QYTTNEVLKINACLVPEDTKKKNSEANKNISDCEDNISTTISEISISNFLLTNKSVLSSNKSTPSASFSTSKKRQTFLDNCIICQLSEKDNQKPRNKRFFNFIISTIKLPNRQTISNRILLKVLTKLNEDILERVCADGVGITAVFDSWTNIKQEHLFGVVLITSQGVFLIWNACNISNQ